MTRRRFLSVTAVAPIALSNSQRPLTVPVQQIIDGRAKCTPEQLQRFSSVIWPEADRDFGCAGIQLQSSHSVAEIRRSPSGMPLFSGLAHGVINLVLTDHIPMEWDRGRALSGITTRYYGYHLCAIALKYAHGHQIPFLSVNTCVHEFLHVLLQDIFESRPNGLLRDGREF